MTTFNEATVIISNINTIEGVVAHINDCDTNKNLFAAAYAYNADEEAGYGIDADNIEAHLDVLSEAGAEFDTKKATKIALAA